MPNDNPPTAVLFDLDGTLVDSNYLHVDAWDQAFAEVGHPVPAWRIHRSIGRDSQGLLDSLLGDAAASVGERAKAIQSERYLALAPRLRPFDQARNLVRAVHDAGARVVFATSAPDDELAILRRVLYVDNLLHAVTSAADVDVAKPDPEIVQIALERAGVKAADAFFVGDSVWDMVAAARAGVASIGLLSGGIGADELYDSGALAVYDDAAELLAHLAESPLSAVLDRA
jgi:HAD superfamily hydrolase (TIGR01509 family)